MANYIRYMPLLLSVCWVSLAAYAQAPADPATAVSAPVAAHGGLTDEELHARFSGSFFFSPVETAGIQRALNGKSTSSDTLAAENASAIPPHRVISLAGVLYRAQDDWIVWMNGKKVTPKSLLPEIIDINVKSSSYVSLKWYDRGLNAVISIVLRPHQTYDIVTGVLLPGSE